MPNELSVLRCWHCGGVPSKTKDEIKNVIKDENLTVKKNSKTDFLIISKLYSLWISNKLDFNKVKTINTSQFIAASSIRLRPLVILGIELIDTVQYLIRKVKLTQVSLLQVVTRVELLPNFYHFTGKNLLPIYR